MKKQNNKVYIAAPFFSKAQIETVERIEGFLEELKISYFSPRKEALIIEGKESSEEERKKVFLSNIQGMLSCDSAIAAIDDFDRGVLWEMGFLFANGIPIIGYTEYKERGLNVMLQQSVVGFVHGISELQKWIMPK